MCQSFLSHSSVKPVKACDAFTFLYASRLRRVHRLAVRAAINRPNPEVLSFRTISTARVNDSMGISMSPPSLWP